MNLTAGVMLQTILFAIENKNLTENVNHQVTNVSETNRCYGIYGCFSIEYPWMSEYRVVAYLPASPKDLKVRFPTFTRHNMKLPYILDPDRPEKIKARKFDPKGPFFFIAHGYLAGGDKPWIQLMTEKLLSLKENVNATIIVIDWREASSPPYSKAVGNIRLLGVITAHLINDIYVTLGLKNLDNFHFIGHSLGSHLGGYAGAALQEKFGLKLGRITGLDPAEPYFQQRLNALRLDPSDAKYVDIIHTDATLFIKGGLGITDSIGHVDFFPNGGRDQPGCDKSMMGYIQSEDDSFFRGLEKLLGCSHTRSFDYFIESITTPCPFLAITCPSYQDFANGSCFQCGVAGQSCIRFGYHSHHGYQRMMKYKEAKAGSPINAFLITGEKDRFCRLHYRITVNMTSMSETQEHFGDTGRLSIILVEKNGKVSESIPLDEEAEPHKQGTQKTIVVTSRQMLEPDSAQVAFKYERSLLNPLTWRMENSPRVFISWIHVESLEYKTSVTACPPPQMPFVGTERPVGFHRKHCRESIFPIHIPSTVAGR